MVHNTAKRHGIRSQKVRAINCVQTECKRIDWPSPSPRFCIALFLWHFIYFIYLILCVACLCRWFGFLRAAAHFMPSLSLIISRQILLCTLLPLDQCRYLVSSFDLFDGCVFWPNSRLAIYIWTQNLLPFLIASPIMFAAENSPPQRWTHTHTHTPSKYQSPPQIQMPRIISNLTPFDTRSSVPSNAV